MSTWPKPFPIPPHPRPKVSLALANDQRNPWAHVNLNKIEVSCARESFGLAFVGIKTLRKGQEPSRTDGPVSLGKECWKYMGLPAMVAELERIAGC